jgi:signal peptidase I
MPRRAGRLAGAGAALVVAAGIALAARSGFGASVVDGGSMLPALEPGDVVVFQRRPQRIAAGDVVLVPREGWPAGVAHRVTALVAGGFLSTKGDANPVPDRDLIRTSGVIGRVLMRVPTGRLARFVAAAMGRWYTHEPIEQQAMTERRSHARAALPGTGPRD